ncbi:hypothetical protein MPSYJ_26660 [Mycolicibacterium psychrotolerans]|uniref:Secreted protein n=1 Tax=Mycolicibacterium psychrotolerans TaxID=216929 RepID=A0A7I7MAH6_9MYCO|nr:hypothetical protein [Mycolicibacterium psychrotolerans]BBX69205.1 hypothetical protein MPSYJ_26660 [Mycolicibacterium psychrotolerans]
MWESGHVRLTVIAATSLVALGVMPAPQAAAEPQTCNDPSCVPGITPNVVQGSYCSNTSYYVFGTAVAGVSTRAGRLLFCGSPRRYEPRWFRSPPMMGIREENTDCTGYMDAVAQAPDGLFLACVPMNDRSLWRRGDA